MSRVLALVEGQTEQAFVREVLAPWLTTKGVEMAARLVGKPGHKGGVRAWQSARRDIVAILKEDSKRCCTTMFDYYALPKDWPGVAKAKRTSSCAAVKVVEEAILAEVGRAVGKSFKPGRFIPYVQLHEFEALLFSDTEKLAAVLQHETLKHSLDDILKECGEPEGIDDDPKTAPSKRLFSLAGYYQKVIHGVVAAQRIGLKPIRAACPHFAGWVRQLERLATPLDA